MIVIEDFGPRTLGDQAKEINRKLRPLGFRLLTSENNTLLPLSGQRHLAMTKPQWEYFKCVGNSANIDFDELKILSLVRCNCEKCLK